MQPYPPATVVRFGAFEVDLANAELRKSGLRLRIQEQPFELLAALVARPNEIVTRDELVARLWPRGTFVDYDRSLNAAVARLRQLLNDSAETPRYIETVPRRGYRFVAPVEFGNDAGAKDPALLQPAATNSVAPSVADDSRGNARTRWRNLVAVSAVAMLVVIVRQVTSPSPPPRIIGYSQITHDGRAKAYLNNARPIIVTDASRVYFIETATGPMRSALHQVSQSGGETSPVAIELQENVEIGDISPDGSHLLLQSFVYPEPEMRLWTLNVAGGTPRLLGDLRGRDPTWSPDGQSIAYAKGDALYVCKADGSENRLLVSGRAPIRWPRWAPDGSVLRYTRGIPGAVTIIEEVSVRGGHPRPLLPGWKGAHCCGNWTGDGKHYFFQSPAGGSTNLWLISERRGLLERATKPTRLTAGPIDFQSAVPSKDGTRLFAIGTKPRGELVRYDAKARQFLPYLRGVSAVDVETSRDGKWCVYVKYPDHVLWRSKVDGTERLQLTPPSMNAAVPRWSPDGRHIAFMGRTGDEPWAIYMVSPEGGKLERLLTEQQIQVDPSWSSDGAFLAFGRFPGLEASMTIQVVNLNTKQVSTVPGSEGLFSPHWSPDGRYMLALTAVEQRLRLHDFNKGTWQALSDIPAAYPNWSGDGQYVHFINPYVAVPALYRMRVSDGSIDRVVNLDPQQLGWTMAGKWTGLASDNSPLVLRDTGIQEIFSLELELP